MTQTIYINVELGIVHMQYEFPYIDEQLVRV